MSCRKCSDLLHLHEVHELAAALIARHAVNAALAAHVIQNAGGHLHFLFRRQRLLEHGAGQLVERGRDVTARAAVSARRVKTC
jgi:hypothetical protein